jgi:3-oxoacyl-[acyl-carrier protein] reductase
MKATQTMSLSQQSTKQVLITGGTKGIGRAVARDLAAHDYNLWLTYASDTEAAGKLRDELEELYGREVHLSQIDIGTPDSADILFQELEAAAWWPSALVFNAGLTLRSVFETMQAADWERVMRGNLNFPVFLLQKLLPHIPRGGSLVFTGSAMGVYPHATSLAYGVSKSAVHALVKNLVKVLAPYGIHVGAVAPGFVDTDWQKNKPADIRRNIEGKIALGRFCPPEELAPLYRLLIENSYLDGEILLADGGYSYK